MSDVASLFLLLTSGPPGPGAKKILGEATDAVYKHQIVIQGWNWTLTRSSESTELTKIGSSIPPPPNSVEPSLLKFEKTVCRATSGMLAAMREGELLTAVFSLEEDSDPDFLLQLTLGGVLIKDYDLSIDDAQAKESWELHYGTIRFDYTPNYKEGKLTVNLTRDPNASDESPANGSVGGKIETLANKMEPAELRPLLKRLQTDLDSGRLGTSLAKTTKPGKPSG